MIFFNIGVNRYTKGKQYVIFKNYTSSNGDGKINYNGNELANNNINYELKENLFVFHSTEYTIGEMIYDFEVYSYTYYSLSKLQ